MFGRLAARECSKGRLHMRNRPSAAVPVEGMPTLLEGAYEILRDPDLREQYDHARQEQARRKQRERAVRNLFVVVAVAGFALGALALGLVKAVAPNSFLANIDHTEKFERSSSLLSDKAAQNQELADLRQAMQQAEGLAATYQELLTQERARNL